MQAQTSDGEFEAAGTIWREKISDEEIHAYERVLAEFQERGDEKEASKILGQLGILYYMRGEGDLAIEYYEKDMEISEALGDRHGLASTYNNLGLVYADKGEWDIAIEYYEKDMEIFKALGDRHGVGITLSNIGKGYLDRSDLVEAKRNLEEAIKKIRPDARPDYPNALNWLAISLRMTADQKKHEAKLATSGADRARLVSDAAKLYREAAERYEETHGLPLARMPRSLLMDAHLMRGLSYSVRNVTEEGAGAAIKLLDRAIEEMVAALEFADGADAIRIEGAITSHKAKRCVREIGLHREDAKYPYPLGALTIAKKIIRYFRKKKRDRLLDRAIDYLGEASESFGDLGETGACSRKTCDGCRHLYTALGLIRDGYRGKSNRKIIDAVSEIRLAEECYQSISNELGTDVLDQVNEILMRVADNLKNAKGFDPGGAVDAANNVFDALDEIAGVGLRNMIKILVWDEAGNVTERKISEGSTTGGDSARDGGVILSGTIGDSATINIGTGNESLPKKRKSVSWWDFILGAISGFSVDAIAIILMHYYFEESVKSHPILLVTLFVITLFTTIFIRHKISKSET